MSAYGELDTAALPAKYSPANIAIATAVLAVKGFLAFSASLFAAHVTIIGGVTATMHRNLSELPEMRGTGAQMTSKGDLLILTVVSAQHPQVRCVGKE